MVFKRKKKLTIFKNLKSLFFPERGWRRAIEYISHRIRRLPDTPHRIALGLSFGVLASFSPLFGFHFLLGAFLAYLFSANVFASILGTFFGNPITFPFIWGLIYKVGTYVTTIKQASFSYEINFNMIINHTYEIFFPMLVGGIVIAPLVWIITYFIIYSFISSYKRRKNKKKRRSI